MEPDKPSISATINSTLKAAHLILDDEPKIFEDRFALSFIGQDFKSFFINNKEVYQTPQMKFIRSMILCRSRYTEDLLYEAISRGVKQYVILGAGLDSFAFQNANLSDRLQVFEVDHPASQRWKHERIELAGISLPKNLSFIPIDFERQSLEDGMAQGGYIPDDPTFFSWLGVTYYIPEDAVFDTLHYVATSAAPNSEIVFDYIFPESMLSEEELQQAKSTKKSLSKLGEPIISTFRPEYMVAKLKETGFDQIDEIDRNKVENYTKNYFLNRNDGLILAFGMKGTAIIRARVQRK